MTWIMLRDLKHQIMHADIEIDIESCFLFSFIDCLVCEIKDNYVLRVHHNYS